MITFAREIQLSEAPDLINGLTDAFEGSLRSVHINLLTPSSASSPLVTIELDDNLHAAAVAERFDFEQVVA